MENPEEILHHLEEFTKLKPMDIPRELEEYLKFVAKTGDPVYQWPTIKYLFQRKFIDVITEFYKSCPPGDIPPCPNVEVFNYSLMNNYILDRLDAFAAAPFTLQRICELLTNPRKEYTRIDKYMRALEKNILVVSTMEPGGRRTENGDSMMNGIESDGDYVHVPEPAAVVNVQEDPTPFEAQATSQSSEELADTKQAEKNSVINGDEDIQYVHVSAVSELLSSECALLPSECTEPPYLEQVSYDEEKKSSDQNDKMIIEIPSSTNQMLVYVPFDAFKSGQVSIEPVSEGDSETTTEQEKPVDETITITAVNIDESSSSNNGENEQNTEKPTTPVSLLTDNLLESTDLLLEKIKNRTEVETESEAATTTPPIANIPVSKKEDSDVRTSFSFGTASDSTPATTTVTSLQTTTDLEEKTTAGPEVVEATEGDVKDQEDVDVISELSSTSFSQDSLTIANKEDNNISPENSISSSDSSGDSHCQSSTDLTSISVKDSAIPQEKESGETVATTEETTNIVDSTTSTTSEESELTTAQVPKEQAQSAETPMEVDVSDDQASEKPHETLKDST